MVMLIIVFTTCGADLLSVVCAAEVVTDGHDCGPSLQSPYPMH
jgi:hypothetical protein